ncbi:MAG: hypothetical protein GYA17_17815 [Chloroflexi bacterium]|nr:roadblock/LC7 domain-containing protein [Anaerolineaceae bacterium]NMB90220.1 hypothetical protein [Chloroflexota bacterium]
MLVRSAEVQSLLQDLIHECPGVESAVLVSQDGILLASNMTDETKKERFSLMIASFLSLAMHMGDVLHTGAIQQALVKGKDGYLVMVSIQDRGILACLANNKAKLGWITLEMNQTAARLSEHIHPVAYGTAMLNPGILEQFEKKR